MGLGGIGEGMRVKHILGGGGGDMDSLSSSLITSFPTLLQPTPYLIPRLGSVFSRPTYMTHDGDCR